MIAVGTTSVGTKVKLVVGCAVTDQPEASRLFLHINLARTRHGEIRHRRRAIDAEPRDASRLFYVKSQPDILRFTWTDLRLHRIGGQFLLRNVMPLRAVRR